MATKKKIKRKGPKTHPLRAQMLETTMPDGKLTKHIAAYGKSHGLTPKEATAKLLTIAVNRHAALSKYNSKPAVKRAKRAKSSPGKIARARKAKSAKPRKAAARKVKTQAAAPASQE